MTTATAPTGHLAPSISLGTRLAGFSHLLRLAWRRDRILVPSSVLGPRRPRRGVGAGHPGAVPHRRGGRDRAGRRADQPLDRRPVRPDRLAHRRRPRGVQDRDDGRLPHRGARLRRRAAAHPHRGGRGAPRAARRRGRRPLVRAGGRRHPRDGRRGRGQRALGRRSRRARAWTPPAASPSRWRGWPPGSPWSGSAPWPCSWPRPRRGPPASGFGFLGAAFALRAMADSADPGTVVHALGWLSPLGWAGRVEAYGANRQWVLLLGLLTLVARRRSIARRRPRPPRPGGRADPGPQRPCPCRPPAHRTVLPGHPARPGHDHRLDRRHGRSAASLVGSLLGSVADMADDPGIRGPAREARWLRRHVRGHLRGHRDPLRRGRRRRRGHRPRAAARGVRARRASARWCCRPRRAGCGGSPPTSPCPWPSPPRSWRCSAPSSGWSGPPATPERARRSGRRSARPWSALPAVWVVIGVAAALAGAAPRFAPFAWGVLLVTFIGRPRSAR